MNEIARGLLISVAGAFIFAVLQWLWKKGWPRITEGQKKRADASAEWMNNEIMLCVRYPAMHNHNIAVMYEGLISFAIGTVMAMILILPAPKIATHPISPLGGSLLILESLLPEIYTSWLHSPNVGITSSPVVSFLVFGIFFFGFFYFVYKAGKGIIAYQTHLKIILRSRLVIQRMTFADQMLVSNRVEREARYRKESKTEKDQKT